MAKRGAAQSLTPQQQLVARAMDVSYRRSGLTIEAWGRALTDHAGMTPRSADAAWLWKSGGTVDARIYRAAALILTIGEQDGSRPMTVDELEALGAEELGLGPPSWLHTVYISQRELRSQGADHRHAITALQEAVRGLREELIELRGVIGNRLPKGHGTSSATG